MIWEFPDGKQLLGPEVAEIELREPAEGVSPFPLELGVAFDAEQHRYVVTRLLVRADLLAHGHDGATLTAPLRISKLLRAPHLPPITARSVASISIPTVLRRGLSYAQFRERYRNADGDMVEGTARSGDLSTIYLLARARGEDPTKAVAAELEISVEAARQRVARARQADPPLLPPSTRGAR